MQKRAEEMRKLMLSKQGYTVSAECRKLEARSYVDVIQNGCSGDLKTAIVAAIEPFFSSDATVVAAAWHAAHDGVTVRKLPADDKRPGLAGTLNINSIMSVLLYILVLIVYRLTLLHCICS
jgi:hypothetical protein